MYTTRLSLFVSEVRNRRLLSQRQGWVAWRPNGVSRPSVASRSSGRSGLYDRILGCIAYDFPRLARPSKCKALHRLEEIIMLYLKIVLRSLHVVTKCCEAERKDLSMSRGNEIIA